MQHSQNDFIIPALLVIDSHEGGCSSATIKDEIHLYIDLSEDDLAPYGSRKKEPRYRQTVGNLISHRTPSLFQYMQVIEIKKSAKQRRSVYFWKLNDEGQAYVKNMKRTQEVGQKLIDNTNMSSPNTSIIDIDLPVISPLDQKKLDTAGKRGRSTDSNLKDAMLVISGYQCFYGKIAGENHVSFSADNGKPYMEIHHFIPMKASNDFYPRNLDRASNLVCLCPMCHEQVHHGSKEDKEVILKVLYDKLIDNLNDEEIYISYNQLLGYYL